jgi:hypothetical protein
VGYAVVLLVIDTSTAIPLKGSLKRMQAIPSGFRWCSWLAWRWFWIPPLYVLLSLFVLIVTLSQGASAAQFMYRNF